MKKKLTREQREERKVSIYTMRSLGKTYKEIGDEFGISRERVRQIGLKIEDGNPILFGNIQIKGKIERICPVCQKTFLVYSSKKKRVCSMKCKGEFYRKYSTPEEAKKAHYEKQKFRYQTNKKVREYHKEHVKHWYEKLKKNKEALRRYRQCQYEYCKNRNKMIKLGTWKPRPHKKLD